MIRNCLTVPETAARLGCGRTKVFYLLEAGVLARGASLSKGTLVTIASIEALERALAPKAPRNTPAAQEREIPLRANRTVGDAFALAFDYLKASGT